MAMRVGSWMFCEVEFLRPRALLGINRKGTAKAVSIITDYLEHLNLDKAIIRRSSFPMNSTIVIPHFRDIPYVMFYSMLLHYTAYALRVKHR